jgi:hypothetical protein
MRSRLIVLWLLLALLPLRGWAYGSMQVDMATLALATTSPSAGPATHAHASTPCHDAAASTHASASADPLAGGHAGCALCDLCHGVALFNALPPPCAVPLAVTRVRPGCSADTGRYLLGGLERPPRFFLA